MDTGAGIAQVLPLIVQHFQRNPVKTGFLEIVEQPELHLHPAAHASLADLYVHAAKARFNQFLIETHSEIFLLRLQFHVAKGHLKHDDVVVYWVDDRKGMPKVCEITFNDKGELSDWPKGIFSEDFDEVKRIRRAQQEARG